MGRRLLPGRPHTLPYLKLLPAAQVERGELSSARALGRQSGEVRKASVGSQLGRQVASEGSIFLMVAGKLNADQIWRGGLRRSRDCMRGQRRGGVIGRTIGG